MVSNAHSPSKQSWSIRMADSVLKQTPVLSEKWDYDWGVTLTGIERVWKKTADPKYFTYIKSNIDRFILSDGSIPKYNLQEYNIDRINTGKLLFGLLDETGDERYKKALDLLRNQLNTHPRTREGGFWHKLIYPHQMWLDGIYMGAPFYTQYSVRYGDSSAFSDIALQIILMEEKSRDPKTGLLYHGWDEIRQQRWSNPDTGCSPHFWSRAMGWYGMALVDVLEHFPVGHAKRNEIIDILKRFIIAIQAVQDEKTGLWYQVLDQGKRAGNYLEASGSCMFLYTIAKSVRLQLIDPAYLDIAKQGYSGVVKNLVRVGDDQLVYLENTCAVAGLGGDPYRDGTFAYYVGEPKRTNDPKGVGAFLLASVELESMP